MHVMQLAAEEKTALTVQYQEAVSGAILTGNLLNSICQDLVWQRNSEEFRRPPC